MGQPSFSPPPKKPRLHVYSCQGKFGCVFPQRITICTTVFPHLITLCIRLMFNLVKVGKEWAGPVFPHALKSKGYLCIHDRVRLAVFFPQTINHTNNSFPPPDNLLNKVEFNLVRVGKEWAGPVFPQPLTSKDYMCIHDKVRLAVFFAGQLTMCTTVFPHLITF